MIRKILIAAIGMVGVAMPAMGLVGPPGGGGGGSGPVPALVRISPPPRPIPPPGYVYQWVPPVYQTVMDRVWIPERTEWVRQWVEITPGRLEEVMRQVTTPGHYDTTTRTVLVSNGYWQLVMMDPLPPPVIIPSPPRPVVVWNPGTVNVDGYKPGGLQTEDLSKFSGLKEWPK